MILLPAGNPSPWTGPTGNNTFLLPGAVPTLIDAGVGYRNTSTPWRPRSAVRRWRCC